MRRVQPINSWFKRGNRPFEVLGLDLSGFAALPGVSNSLRCHLQVDV